MSRRWLPHPMLSTLLALVWIVLNQSLSAGTVLLAVVLGLALGRAFSLLDPPRARVRNAPVAVRLLFRVIGDIVRSNLAVARLVLWGNRDLQSGFVAIPMTLTDHYGLAVLACIITSTPGTVWVSYDPTTNQLLIHVLDLQDHDAWIRHIQDRYERPLLEIFE